MLRKLHIGSRPIWYESVRAHSPRRLGRASRVPSGRREVEEAARPSSGAGPPLLPERVVGVGGDAPAAAEERRVQAGLGPRPVEPARVELLPGDVEDAASAGGAAARAVYGRLLYIDGGIEAKGGLDLRLEAELGHGQGRGEEIRVHHSAKKDKILVRIQVCTDAEF